MRCLWSGNDFCGDPEVMCCNAHPRDLLTLSTHNTFGESIANAGMRYSFGIVQLSENPGERRKHCKASVKEQEAWGWESVCFPFS